MDIFEQAQYYVGNVGANYFKVGQLQLELLKRNGLTPSSRVLEIGCGCLAAGRPILEFLNADRYAAIEPNRWLIDAVLEGLPDTQTLFEAKRPVFLQNADFDASSLGIKFDFVISHSILSHAAHSQCPQFFRGVKAVLAEEGIALASIRFFDAENRLMGDSLSPEWVYPGVSYFAWDTVRQSAAQEGLHVEWRHDYREFFTLELPSNFHDWIRLTHA
jgi:hypothetical protein